MEVEIKKYDKENKKTVQKIVSIFQRILGAMMDVDKFSKIWAALKKFADWCESDLEEDFSTKEYQEKGLTKQMESLKPGKPLRVQKMFPPSPKMGFGQHIKDRSTKTILRGGQEAE